MYRRFSVLLAIVTVGAVFAIAPAPARAQEKKVDVNIGGGYTVALSEVRNHLGDGYNVNVGLTVNVTPTIGIQAEYSFNGLGKKEVNIPVYPQPLIADPVPQRFYGDMNMQYGNFNVLFKPQMEGKAKPYLVAGLGVYYRPIKVTTPAVGWLPGYCDPWWYVCVPGGLVPVDQIVGSRSSTDFGIDFGGGVNFALSNWTSFYVEVRYHYIWGPEVATTYAVGNNQAQKANGQFLPITFGVRF